LLVIAAIITAVYFSLPKVISAIGFIVSLFLPFLLGYVFSMLVNPLADKLQSKLKLPRGLSAIIVLVMTVGIIGSILTGIIWKIFDEVRNLYYNSSSIYENMQNTLLMIQRKWSAIHGALPENVQFLCDNMIRSVGEKMSRLINVESLPVVEYAGNFAKRLPGIFIGLIVFILSSFFMVSDSKTVSAAVHKLMSEKTVRRYHIIKENLHSYLGGYIKAQLIIMSIAFVIIFTGLSILKVEYALLIAVTIAVFDALPFFGSGGVLVPWAIINFIGADVKTGVGLLVIYLSILLTRQLIEPKIVSQNIGMHPIITLMSMYIGYRTFSIGGLILGPITMMVFISLHRAGVFDGLYALMKFLRVSLKSDFRNVKNYLIQQFGGKPNG
jgi:sporulation integral membrane protein YtvI